MTTGTSWLKREIGAGFMLLSALNLKGRPAADDLEAVAKIWYGLLGRQKWQQERDIKRIRAAFQAIAEQATEWPNPADFKRYLPEPEVKMVPRIEKKHEATPYGKAVLEEIKSRLKDTPIMNRDWIHGTPHRTPEECRKIYEAKMKGKQNGN